MSLKRRSKARLGSQEAAAAAATEAAAAEAVGVGVAAAPREQTRVLQCKFRPSQFYSTFLGPTKVNT